MTVAQLVPEISTITEYRVVDTTQFGWNGLWQVNDRLSFALRRLPLRVDRVIPAARTRGSSPASPAITRRAST